MTADEARQIAAILRAGVPKRKDVARWADDLDRHADRLEYCVEYGHNWNTNLHCVVCGVGRVVVS